ncbi:MAG: tyrosine--tRNA ligase [bacterium]|nr:tyrosine--tRNA ligase [bacterium]
MKKGKEQLIEGVLERGVEEVIVAAHLKKQLHGKKKLRVKLGIDPTGADLHLGHSIPLRKLQAFADLGHTPVLIIGDWTARIGDPSGKDATRPRLSKEEVKKNASSWLEQVKKVLDLSKTEVHYQSEWFDDFDLEKAIHLTAQMTLGQVMAHETFRKRMQKGASGLGLHELLYPLLQGYDSVAVRADVELGASEQKFNVLAGREMQKAYKQEPQDVMLVSYLTGLDGKEKMSKSLGNYIALNDSATDVYGKVMSIPDALMKQYSELLTNLDWNELRRMGPRNAKGCLALAVTDWLHGDNAATEAAEKFTQIFSKREAPEDVPAKKIIAGITIVDALIVTGLATSKSEGRRLIEQRGVKVNGLVVRADVKPKSGDLIQVGKRKFVRIR